MYKSINRRSRDERNMSKTKFVKNNKSIQNLRARSEIHDGDNRKYTSKTRSSNKK